MSAQTILLDLSIEPDRISDTASQKDVVKQLEKGLNEFFPNLCQVFETSTNDGYYCLYSENGKVMLASRLYHHGLITINIDFYKGEHDLPAISFDVSICVAGCYIHIAR